MDTEILICDEQYSPDARRVHKALTQHDSNDFSLELFDRHKRLWVHDLEILHPIHILLQFPKHCGF